MAGYVLADVRITDETLFAEYRERVTATAEAHGGKYLVRGGAVEVIQGDWAPRRVVVVEFDNVEQARAWQSSLEYAELKVILDKSSNTNVIIVEGV